MARGEAETEAGLSDSLFRREAVRHNTPGLFGEVVLAAPPTTWVLAGVSVVAAGFFAWLLFGLEIDGQPLLDWLRSR